eukprot:7183823-Pyramimonas_sp.AAC.1
MQLLTCQSDAGSVGIFPRWTNQTQEAWVYSHDGPISRWRFCFCWHARHAVAHLPARRSSGASHGGLVSASIAQR